MTFELFGFDFSSKYNIYGFWFGRLKWDLNDSYSNRSLFHLYHSDGEWYLDLFWIHILTS